MELKNDNTLTENQQEILVGLLLGDGHLETRNNGRTYRLKVEHSSKQLDYTEWLFQVFKNLCEQTELYRRVRSDGRVSVGFTTQTIRSFCFYGQQFYTDKKKRIPPLIHKLLTPQTLAIWFMDDGSRKSKKHNTYNIHTLGYTKTDLERVSDKLLITLGISTTLHAQRSSTWRLYIGAATANKFTQMIKPYVEQFPSMQKKLVNEMPKK
jgi:hypothetical protein